MRLRQTILILLAATFAVVALAWLGISQSAPNEQEAVIKKAATLGPDKPIRNPFPNASEVRLFVEIGHSANGGLIYSEPEGRVLTASERSEFESLIAVHTISPNEAFAACFIPHHFFRYYDKAGKQIGEIKICFCCAGVQSDGSNVHLNQDEVLTADFRKLKSFVASLGQRTDVECDDA